MLSNSQKGEARCHVCQFTKSVGNDKHKLCSIIDTDYLALTIKWIDLY